MSNPERGAYTPPTDAPLTFDARQPVRGHAPPPVVLILSAVVLVLLVAAIAVFYRSGVRQAATPPPVVGAPVGPIKTEGPVGVQFTDPGTGLQIYTAVDGAPQPGAAAEPKFAPGPEQPAERAAPSEAIATAPKETPPPPAAQATLKPSVGVVQPLPAKPVAAEPLVKPPALAAQIKAPSPKPQSPPPATVPAAAPKPGAASGAAAVQIGAYSSQALADKGWSDAAKVAPGMAAGKGKSVEAIEKGGATLYRTAVTGFTSRAEAGAFCNALKAAGKACFVR